MGAFGTVLAHQEKDDYTTGIPYGPASLLAMTEEDGVLLQPVGSLGRLAGWGLHLWRLCGILYKK